MSVRSALLLSFALVASGAEAAAGSTKVVRVFVLAGQSNMVGWSHVRTLGPRVKSRDRSPLLARLRQRNGEWIERDDVFVHANVGDRVRKGRLTVGYGGGDDGGWFGPELMFGHEMGDRFDEPVLLIKAAWGGKDLYCDFRPPSAGAPEYEIPPRDGEARDVGASYRKLVAHVRAALDGLATDFPELRRHEVELAGFVWFQGWNEMFCDDAIREQVYAEYPANFAALLSDLRAEFDAPDLPAVVGELGVNGDGANERIRGLRAAQARIPDEPSLAGAVTFVETASLWDDDVDAAWRRLEETRSEARRRLRPKLERKLNRKLRGRSEEERERLLREETERAAEETKEVRAAHEAWEEVGSHWECHYHGSGTMMIDIGRALANGMEAHLGERAD